jgi:hypothetical protein
VRLRGALTAAVLILGLARLCAADVIVFRDGRRLEGKIVGETEESLTVQVKYGEVVVPKRNVASIEKGPTSLEEYEKKSAAVEDDAKAHFELGQWCEQKGLEEEAKKEYLKALQGDPAYAPAGRALGYENVEGKWLSPDEAKKARGLVEFEGKWMPEKDRDGILAERDAEKQDELRKKYNVGPEFFVAERKVCVLISDLPEDERKKLLAIAQAVYADIESRFGKFFVKKHDWPLVTFAFSKRDDFRKRMKDEGIEEAEEAYGYYAGPKRASYLFKCPLPGTEQMLQHEFTHQVHVERMMKPGRSRRSKAWVFEGLAEYYEGRDFKDGKLGKPAPHIMNLAHVKQALNEGKLIPLDKLLDAEKLTDLHGTDYNCEECFRAYGQAWALVYYLIEGNGGANRAKFERFFKKDVEGEGTPEEFKRIFGGDLDKFQKDFEKFVRQLK